MDKCATAYTAASGRCDHRTDLPKGSVWVGLRHLIFCCRSDRRMTSNQSSWAVRRHHACALAINRIRKLWPHTSKERTKRNNYEDCVVCSHRHTLLNHWFIRGKRNFGRGLYCQSLAEHPAWSSQDVASVASRWHCYLSRDMTTISRDLIVTIVSVSVDAKGASVFVVRSRMHV